MMIIDSGLLFWVTLYMYCPCNNPAFSCKIKYTISLLLVVEVL